MRLYDKTYYSKQGILIALIVLLAFRINIIKGNNMKIKKISSFYFYL